MTVTEYCHVGVCEVGGRLDNVYLSYNNFFSGKTLKFAVPFNEKSNFSSQMY